MSTKKKPLNSTEGCTAHGLMALIAAEKHLKIMVAGGAVNYRAELADIRRTILVLCP